MKTQLMRHFAIALGFGLYGLGVGHSVDVSATDFSQPYTTAYQPATTNYQAPAKWNQFQRPTVAVPSQLGQPNQLPFGASVQSVATQNNIDNLPAPNKDVELVPPGNPQPVPVQQPSMAHQHVHQHAPAAVAPMTHSYSNVAPHQSAPVVTYDSAPMPQVGSAPCASDAGCSTGNCGPQPYSTAPSWDSSVYATGCDTPSSSIGPISPWYGGLDLLFWKLEDDNPNVLVSDDNSYALLRVRDLAPDSQLGFNARLGRYLGCGSYGLDVSILYWDPDDTTRNIPDYGNGLRFTMPAVRTTSIDRGAGATTVYDDYDTNATDICATRDVRVKGIEVNLSSFGLMGARRLGSASPPSIFANTGVNAGYNLGLSHGYGFGLGPAPGCGTPNVCRPQRLFGGALGPLARACSGRLRVRTSHGFRWFQLEDELQISGDVDGTSGYSGSDIYYEIETENNLFGYQFGSQLTYCVGCRLMVNVGGKIGVYGNDAEFAHWIANDMTTAYTDSQGAGPGDIYTRESANSLAGLGEFDLGIGYRLSNRCSVTGGYRILSACGVVTSVGGMPTEYTSVASAGSVRADDCFTLHGAYVGFNYNW